jgi:hypothetical protein
MNEYKECFLWRRHLAGGFVGLEIWENRRRDAGATKRRFPSGSIVDQTLRTGLVIKSTKSFLKRSWSISCRTFTSPAEGGGPR